MELKKAVHLVKIIGLKQATSDYIKIDKEDRIRNGIAIIVLQYCIDSMNELLNK